jgi:hypothetical protein
MSQIGFFVARSSNFQAHMTKMLVMHLIFISILCRIYTHYNPIAALLLIGLGRNCKFDG